MTRALKVEVLQIKPNGILVKILKNNRVGFIGRREISWDRRVDARRPTFQVGQQLEARLIRDKKGRRYAELSLRRLSDPWEDGKDRYQVDQAVRGEIVNIRCFGAFVQLEPGIDAIIHPRGIPLARGEGIEDVLSVGDQIQGIITDVDPNRRRIEVDLTKRLQQLSVVAPEQRRSIQQKLLQDGFGSNMVRSILHSTDVNSGQEQASRQRYHPPIPKPSRVLIVDDNKDELDQLCSHLRDLLEVKVDGVQTREEAIGRIKGEYNYLPEQTTKDEQRRLPSIIQRVFGKADAERASKPNARTTSHRPSGTKERWFYDLVIIDLMLDDDRGTRVAEDILRIQPGLNIVFISFNPQAAADIPVIYGQRFPFVYKHVEALGDTAVEIERLLHGCWEIVREPQTGATFTSNGDFAQQLGMSATARRPLGEILESLLAQLRKEVSASYALVLEVDSANKTVSCLAMDPLQEREYIEQSLDGLFYSPVRSVIEDQDEFHGKNIWPGDPQYKDFFPLLEIKSCLGIPLMIPDFTARHVLLLLDKKRSRFEADDVGRARLTARFVQVALEQDLLLNYMQRYEQRYSLGQLLGSLVHELRIKLDGMGVEDLSDILKDVTPGTEPDDQLERLAEAQEIAKELVEAKQELVELTNAYSRLAKGDLETVDVSAVVQKVVLQLESRAKEAYVSIHVEEQDHLPCARAIRSRLEQIVMNLTLNAIQQIDRQQRKMAQIAWERGQDGALLQQGQVIIQILHKEGHYPIRIIVTDTGPGIHYHQQEEIFLLDTSTREEGHGLGLFISCNMAERMGGRVRLIDSLIFLGSAFVIELPKSLAVEEVGK